MCTIEKHQKMKNIIRIPYELDITKNYYGSLYGYINKETGIYTVLDWDGNESGITSRTNKIGSIFCPSPNIYYSGFSREPFTVLGSRSIQRGSNGQLVQDEYVFNLLDIEGYPSIELQKEVYSDFNTRKKYIDMEIPHINNFLLDFNFIDPNIRPEIIIDDNYNWFGIRNFPLPDDFLPDYIDIAVITGKYPVGGLTGFYINSESLNKSKIKEKIGNCYGFSKEVNNQADNVFELPGWSWIDFRHYENILQRNFTTANITQSDNLANFVKAVYASLWVNNDDKAT